MKQLLRLVALLLLIPAIASADPYIAFQDITDGLKSGLGDSLGEGAIVTIWGNGLGSSQGTSKVYYKDSLGVSREAAHVYYWKASDGELPSGPASLPTVYFALTEIAFSIPSASADGAGKIYVKVGGQNSNEVDFYARSTGRFWFVSLTGSDGAPGTYAAPRQTISALTQTTALLDPGDTIYALGSYVNTLLTIQIGGSTGNQLNGTANNMYGIMPYPGARLSVKMVDMSYANDYWVVSKIETTNNSMGIQGSAFGRIIGNDVHGNGGNFSESSSDGMIDAGADFWNPTTQEDYVNGIVIIGNEIHHSGDVFTTNRPHATYLRIRSCYRPWDFYAPTLAYNYVHDNGVRYGLHWYDEGSCVRYAAGECELQTTSTCGGNLQDDILIYNNVIENQEGPGIGVTHASQYTTTFGAKIFNNLLINTGKNYLPRTAGGYALAIRGSTLGGHFIVANNTIYGYGQYDVDGGALWIPYLAGQTSSGPSTYEWKNNIIVDTEGKPWHFDSALKTPTVITTNIWRSTTVTPPTFDTSPITADPLFTNVATNDFTLQSTSPARDTGTSQASLFTRDLKGVLRGSTWDIGAFEYAEGEAPAPATHRLRAKPLLP